MAEKLNVVDKDGRVEDAVGGLDFLVGTHRAGRGPGSARVEGIENGANLGGKVGGNGAGSGGNGSLGQALVFGRDGVKARGDEKAVMGRGVVAVVSQVVAAAGALEKQRAVGLQFVEAGELAAGKLRLFQVSQGTRDGFQIAFVAGLAKEEHQRF